MVTEAAGQRKIKSETGWLCGSPEDSAWCQGNQGTGHLQTWTYGWVVKQEVHGSNSELAFHISSPTHREKLLSLPDTGLNDNGRSRREKGGRE